MRVLCVSENNDQSFKSINLSKKAEVCSARIIKGIAKGDFSKQSKDKFYADL